MTALVKVWLAGRTNRVEQAGLEGLDRLARRRPDLDRLVAGRVHHVCAGVHDLSLEFHLAHLEPHGVTGRVERGVVSRGSVLVCLQPCLRIEIVWDPTLVRPQGGAWVHHGQAGDLRYNRSFDQCAAIRAGADAGGDLG